MPVAAHHHTAHIWLRHYCYHSTLKQQERSSSTSTLTFLAYTLAYWILAKRPLAAPIIEDLATCGGFSTTTVESSHGAVKAIWTNNISVAHLHCSQNVNWSTFLEHHPIRIAGLDNYHKLPTRYWSFQERWSSYMYPFTLLGRIRFCIYRKKMGITAAT